MAQNPLPPPPPSGGVLDGWLYLLWRRLTQTGQILWDSITPGTSADVAAVVTDETGSPGSLVFSGNPTLGQLTVTGLVNVGDTTAPAGLTQLALMLSSNTVSGSPFFLRKSCDAINGPNFTFLKSRGTAASPTAVSSGDIFGGLIFSAFDGTNYTNGAQVISYVDGAVSAGVVPASVRVLTGNSSGVVTEGARVDSTQTVTLGGINTAPALRVTPVASQARWIEVTGATSSTDPTIGTSGGNLSCSAVFMPVQATTAGAPAYVLGGMYFDTTLNKLRIGGATAWETVTSI